MKRKSAKFYASCARLIQQGVSNKVAASRLGIGEGCASRYFARVRPHIDGQLTSAQIGMLVWAELDKVYQQSLANRPKRGKYKKKPKAPEEVLLPVPRDRASTKRKPRITTQAVRYTIDATKRDPLNAWIQGSVVTTPAPHTTQS